MNTRERAACLCFAFICPDALGVNEVLGNTRRRSLRELSIMVLSWQQKSGEKDEKTFFECVMSVCRDAVPKTDFNLLWK